MYLFDGRQWLISFSDNEKLNYRVMEKEEQDISQIMHKVLYGNGDTKIVTAIKNLNSWKKCIHCSYKIGIAIC